MMDWALTLWRIEGSMLSALIELLPALEDLRLDLTRPSLFMTVLAKPMHELKPKLIEGGMTDQRVAWMDRHVYPSLKGLWLVDTIVTDISQGQRTYQCAHKSNLMAFTPTGYYPLSVFESSTG